MTSRLFRWSLCTTLCALVAACSFKKKEEIPRATPVRFPKADAKPGQHRNAGTVFLVNTEGHFVLIDSGPVAPPEPGAALKCMRDGVETGIIAVSKERRGSHVIADIVTGSPGKGDQVIE